MRHSQPLKCAFPGCNRDFKASEDLKLHQRTHKDGDFHAVAGMHTPVVPGAASVSTTSDTVADSRLLDMTKPLILIGPYAHHSNLLPWCATVVVWLTHFVNVRSCFRRKESVGEIVFVPEAPDVGGVDMTALRDLLIANAHRPLIVGAFTAASNITGMTVDVDAVTRLLHVHGALAIWDYAAAAPHLPIGEQYCCCSS